MHEGGGWQGVSLPSAELMKRHPIGLTGFAFIRLWIVEVIDWTGRDGS